MGDSSSADGRPLDDSAPVELTAKILMTAAIVLFIVVIFVLFLHLYAKWFWARVEDPAPASAHQNPTGRRRRHGRRRPVILDPALKGLDPAILRTLPVVIFRPEDFDGGLECAVCLSELLGGEKTRFLPKCSHGFHVDCIDMWFQSHSTCPICRNAIDGDCPNSSTVEIVPDDESGIEMVEENLNVGGQSSESPNFPTNVLFWGNEIQVSSRSAASPEENPSSSASVNVGSTSGSRDGTIMIDIPRPTENSGPMPSRFVEDESKSPVTTRLRSLKRLLSRERRVSPCGPSSGDVEQG